MRLLAVTAVFILASCTGGCSALHQLRDSLAGKVSQRDIAMGCRAAKWAGPEVTSPVVTDYYGYRRKPVDPCTTVVIGGKTTAL